MPGGEQFCLRWNNHQPNLISVFSSLLQNEKMVDCTLMTMSSDDEIHAHKIVLSACSSYFQNIFLRNPCKHPTIVLTDVKFVHLRSLIDFIYNGEVNIMEEHLSELLRIANILKIKGLEEIPSVNIASNESDGFDGTPDEQDLSTLINNNEAVENSFMQSPFSLKEEFLVPEDVTKAIVSSLPSTSDPTKMPKKRKSVSFSETTEIVCSKVSPSQSYSDAESFANGKRRGLRSTTETCTITKLRHLNDSGSSGSDGQMDMEDGTNNNDMVVTINPLSLYADGKDGSVASSTPMKTENGNNNPQQKRQRNSAKRQMIRKNENFLRALEAVRDGNIGFCKAAKIHGVNNRTLWLEYQKLGYPMKNARKKSST